MSGRVVIVGAGQAGLQAAVSLRDGGFTGSVHLVGAEPGLPYHRPPLSKQYLHAAHDAADDLVRLRPASFYPERSIELTGEPATALDLDRAAVCLESGRLLRYDHVVLAVGARSIPLTVPGADLDGVLMLRTLAEARTVRERLRTAGRVVVVGGGFVGLEVAAAARVLGHEVTVIEALGRLLPRAVSAPVSAAAAAHHAAMGTTVLLGARVAEVNGHDGRVRGVTTADGRFVPADLVFVGIGVRPETALAARAGLETDDGIVVDRYLRTADERISVVGDCARFPTPYAAAPVRLESVQNATDQARCAAAAILGSAEPYRALPWFWSHQGTLNLQMAGLGTDADTWVVRGDPGAGAFSVFAYRGDRLLAVDSVNRPADHMAARRILGRRDTISPAQAADPHFNLKARSRQPAVSATG